MDPLRDRREPPKHQPHEVCDCTNPNPGRPYHCAAVMSGPEQVYLVDSQGVARMLQDKEMTAAATARALTLELGGVVEHAQREHGTDQWWVCPGAIVRMTTITTAWLFATAQLDEETYLRGDRS